MSVVLHDDRRPWVVLLLRLLLHHLFPMAYDSEDDDDDDDADGDASSSDEMST